ncbi:phosphatase [Patescibacteria group bacterium]|nr:phosphatase [Patescibacteria group bacterium]
MDLQHYKKNIYIAGKIDPADIQSLVDDYGFSAIVNNRVDDEEEGQPKSTTIATACKDSGVEYYYLPMRDRQDITAEAVTTRDELLKNHQEKNILFFCRTGGRSEALLNH